MVVLCDQIVHDPVHPLGVITHVDSRPAELAAVEGPVLGGVENLEFLVRVGDTELAAVLDLLTTLASLLGGHDDDAGGSAGSVLCGLGGVLKDGDVLDVVR